MSKTLAVTFPICGELDLVLGRRADPQSELCCVPFSWPTKILFPGAVLLIANRLFSVMTPVKFDALSCIQTDFGCFSLWHYLRYR